MSSTRSKLAVAGLVIVAIIVALIWRHSGDGAPRTAAAAEHYATHALPQPAVPDRPLIEGGAPSVELLEKSLADYKAVSVYPSWSRPHSPETIEKLEWNRTVVSDLAMDDRPGHETTYRFGADRWNVPYGEAFVSWIEVVTNGTDKRLPVTIKEARVASADGGRIGALVYHDDGQDGDAVAGDHRYSNRLVPSQFPKLAAKAQQVRIEALIEAGGVTRAITRDFAYAPRKAAEITGASEQLRDGNLVVTLEVNVFEKGLYTFEANVMARDGTPIVYGEKSYPLEPGKRTADVIMFGRAIHEKAIDGPYVVQDIRGMRRFIDTDEQNFFFTYGKTLATRPYRHDELSDAEWNEPERRDRIANFERLIEQTRNGEIGQPTGEPPPLVPGADPALPANDTHKPL